MDTIKTKSSEKAEKYWNVFFRSGKIEDYLKYKEAEEE